MQLFFYASETLVAGPSGSCPLRNWRVAGIDHINYATFEMRTEIWQHLWRLPELNSRYLYPGPVPSYHSHHVRSLFFVGTTDFEQHKNARDG